eukprot:5557974-Amphidinium_carterae.1
MNTLRNSNDVGVQVPATLCSCRRPVNDALSKRRCSKMSAKGLAQIFWLSSLSWKKSKNKWLLMISNRPNKPSNCDLSVSLCATITQQLASRVLLKARLRTTESWS